MICSEEMQTEKIRKDLLHYEVFADIGLLKGMISEYESLMEEFSRTLSLPERAELRPQDQIAEDVRRLNTLAEALEYIVTEEEGLSLAEALQILKRHGGEEISCLINYLEKSDYPLFQDMMAAIDR